MTQRVTINLYTSEILYDIKNAAFLTGKGKQTDGNDKAVALIQAGGTKEDTDRIMRSVRTAYNNIYHAMADYIRDAGTTASNIQWNETTDLTINLHMPDNYNTAVTDTIANSSHNYAVDLALSEWFLITNKQDSDDYAAKAAAEMAEIVRCLNMRTRPKRLLDGQELMKVYWGYVPSVVGAADDIVVKRYLTSRLASRREFVMESHGEVTEKVCYMYPVEWGNIASITDDKGKQQLPNFTLSVIVLDEGQQYNCYLQTISSSIGKTRLTFV